MKIKQRCSCQQPLLSCRKESRARYQIASPHLSSAITSSSLLLAVTRTMLAILQASEEEEASCSCYLCKRRPWANRKAPKVPQANLTDGR